MPRSAYLEGALQAAQREYAAGSWYPAQAGFDLATHITPGEERIKKLAFAFPAWAAARRTYSGLPAVHVVAFGDRAARTLTLCICDLITRRMRMRCIRLRADSLAANRRAADAVVNEIRRAMWRVGPARPDHHAE